MKRNREEDESNDEKKKETNEEKSSTHSERKRVATESEGKDDCLCVCLKKKNAFSRRRFYRRS